MMDKNQCQKMTLSFSKTEITNNIMNCKYNNKFNNTEESVKNIYPVIMRKRLIITAGT